MRITVLGADGAFPGPGGASSGFLVEHDGFRLVLDLGYATVPRLPVAPREIDAVLITHGHPDHCADLNPLLRARVIPDRDLPPLPVYAPAGALDAVLALDEGELLAGASAVSVLGDGDDVLIGPFEVRARALPHFVPNLGYRVSVEGAALAYTGDTGPDPAIVDLARGVDLFIAEATFVDDVPSGSATAMSSARSAGRAAADAGVGALMLTHLLPGASAEAAIHAARRSFPGPITVAVGGATFASPRWG